MAVKVFNGTVLDESTDNAVEVEMWKALGLDEVAAEMQSQSSMPGNVMMGTGYTGCVQCDNTSKMTACEKCGRDLDL